MTDHTDGAGTVLVVEDEAVLRMIGADLLESAGYRVLEAASADEAMRILEGSPDVQVLFSDVRLPGSMDGRALAALVNARWPQIGILLTSGDTHLAQAELPDNGRFVPKPYRLDAIVDEIEAIVRRRDGRVA